MKVARMGAALLFLRTGTGGATWIAANGPPVCGGAETGAGAAAGTTAGTATVAGGAETGAGSTAGTAAVGSAGVDTDWAGAASVGAAAAGAEAAGVTAGVGVVVGSEAGAAGETDSPAGVFPSDSAGVLLTDVSSDVIRGGSSSYMHVGTGGCYRPSSDGRPIGPLSIDIGLSSLRNMLFTASGLRWKCSSVHHDGHVHQQSKGRTRPLRVTATARRYAAATLTPIRPRHNAWSQAVTARRAWLARALATEPADRPAAQQSITAIYARLGRRRPAFVWVDSPRQALPLVAGYPTNDVLWQWIQPPLPPGKPPFASDFAAAVSRLRGALDEAISPPYFDPPPPKRKKHEPWPALPADAAIEAGIPFLEVLRQGVREALRTTLADGLYLPLRRGLAADRPLPTVWYGQQESSWIAYYDICRALGLGQYTASDTEHLADWETLAQSCGWFWPGEDTCVVVERPAVIEMQPVPSGLNSEEWCHVIEYRDGYRPRLS